MNEYIVVDLNKTLVPGVTPDQVAKIVKARTVEEGLVGWIAPSSLAGDLADLFAASDPTFDRYIFLSKCGL